MDSSRRTEAVMVECKIVYSVRLINSNGKVYMHRIGTASTNGDGSISIELEEIPTCKNLLVMDYPEMKNGE
jgi:hypothetical protein